MKFKIGDIVKLKSGGPEMTVMKAGDSLITCQWFAGKKLALGRFEMDSLNLLTEDNE